MSAHWSLTLDTPWPSRFSDASMPTEVSFRLDRVLLGHLHTSIGGMSGVLEHSEQSSSHPPYDHDIPCHVRPFSTENQ